MSGRRDPARIAAVLRRRVAAFVRGPRYPHPLRRRFEGGRLKGLSPEYMRARDAAVTSLVRQVWERGEFDERLLLDPGLANFDERVVEYPYALGAAIEASRAGKIELLDAGCVLNNACIAPILSEQIARKIWLMNASMERLAYDENVEFVVCDARHPEIRGSQRFPLVTCLSTLEHIGMDNTRYGGTPQEFDGELTRPDRYAIDGLRGVSGLVAPGGRLLVSVPFGPFEYVYQYENPGKPIYYTFNREMILALRDSLTGFDATITVFRVVNGHGWVRASIDDAERVPRHAENCAAAGAVAFIEGVRR